MKHKILVISAVIAFILLDIVIVAYAQDTVRIKHINYTTVYSKSLHYPVLVEWWETKANNCSNSLPRKNQFAPDPLLKVETEVTKDYVHAGVDRGHMCPAASNKCMTPQVETECFYFSNMAPQYHSLNAGDWKSVETLSRDLAIKNDSVHIWAGSIGVAKTFGNHKVAVPTQCWKVMYILKDKEYQAYLFDNVPNKPTGVHSHQVTVAEITSLTNFKFN
jgi:endonuclease G